VDILIFSIKFLHKLITILISRKSYSCYNAIMSKKNISHRYSLKFESVLVNHILYSRIEVIIITYQHHGLRILFLSVKDRRFFEFNYNNKSFIFHPLILIHKMFSRISRNTTYRYLYKKKSQHEI